MTNEWKPEKNISSPWDVDTWENNIGQPVKPSGDNLPYPYTSVHIHQNWYDVDTTKLTSAKDIAELLTALEMRVGEHSKNFDKVKKFLIIPEKPKTLEQISQELDEKIDELIENTKNKFYQSKYISEILYDTKFNRIIQDFEYAREHGSFPHKLTFTIGDGLSANNFIVSGSSVESSLVIKQGKKHEGYYTNGNRRYLRYYMPTKPNVIVRFFMKTCLGFWWVDEKDG